MLGTERKIKPSGAIFQRAAEWEKDSLPSFPLTGETHEWNSVQKLQSKAMIIVPQSHS